MADHEDPTHIELAIPGRIDGDPIEVEEIILAGLPALLDEFAEYIDAAATQLANTERTRIVRADKHIDPEQITAVYDASDRAASLARLTDAAKALCAAAAELED